MESRKCLQDISSMARNGTILEPEAYAGPVYRAQTFQPYQLTRDRLRNAPPGSQPPSLGEHHPQQHRRVDVNVQGSRRSSERSSMDPILHLAGERRRSLMGAKGLPGGVMCTGSSSAAIGTIRAIGRLRSVTMTSSPFSTARKYSESRSLSSAIL